MKKSILRVVLWIIIASFMLTVVASCDFRGEQGSQGEKGESGEAGNGIISISKTATDGLIDTYTITYTNGETTTFTVTNGKEGAAGKDVADIHNNVTRKYVFRHTRLSTIYLILHHKRFAWLGNVVPTSVTIVIGCG